MAIVSMMRNRAWSYEFQMSYEISEFPEGAYCPLGGNGYNDWSHPELRYDEKDRNLSGAAELAYRTSTALILYETHHGLCLFERERNMHDDSDFFMTVWNPVGKFAHEIMFATTRGWTYPCLASRVDATPEVRAEYEAWAAAEARRDRILHRWGKRNETRDLRHKLGLTYAQFKRLCDAYTPGSVVFRGCVELLAAKKLRSDFRISMKTRLEDWLKVEKPQFPKPFSRNMEQYIYPRNESSRYSHY